MSEPVTKDSATDVQAAASRSASTDGGQLVGVDGSGGSRHALKWAAARTGDLGLIQPLTTWYFPWWSVTGPTPPPEAEFKRQAMNQAESALGAIPVDRHLPLILCQGQAGPALVDVGSGSGLIVVGTRGRSGLKGSLLGSVSSHVVAHATTPVAVVPADAPIGEVNKRTVVGVDGSDNSIEALVWAMRHVGAESTIEVVHTWSYPPSALPEAAANSRRHFEELAEATVDRTIEAAAAIVGVVDDDPMLRVSKRVEYGDARSVLRESQQDSDLLVVGARGRGGVAHLFVGSVTSALAHQPITTMVVVPPADTDRSAG